MHPERDDMHSSRLYVDDTRNTTGAIITRMTVRFELQGNLRCCYCLPLHVIMISNPSQRFGQYTRDAERGMHQFNKRRWPKSSPGASKTCAANHLHCELLAPCIVIVFGFRGICFRDGDQSLGWNDLESEKRRYNRLTHGSTQQRHKTFAVLAIPHPN